MGTVGPCRGEFSLRIVLPPPPFFFNYGVCGFLFSFREKWTLARARTRRGNVMNVLPGQLLWYAHAFSSHVGSETGVDWWWRWGMTRSGLWSSRPDPAIWGKQLAPPPGGPWITTDPWAPDQAGAHSHLCLKAPDFSEVARNKPLNNLSPPPKSSWMPPESDSQRFYDLINKCLSPWRV